MQDFDAGLSASQISIMQDSQLPHITNTSEDYILQTSNLMYKYRTENTFDGIPVQPQACDLLVSSVNDLQKALVLVREPRVFVQYLTPGDSDVLQKYEDIMRRAAIGQIYVQQESKQFDAAKSAFIVFLKYMELSYTLNPRYKHLAKQERNG